MAIRLQVSQTLCAHLRNSSLSSPNMSFAWVRASSSLFKLSKNLLCCKRAVYLLLQLGRLFEDGLDLVPDVFEVFVVCFCHL